MTPGEPSLPADRDLAAAFSTMYNELCSLARQKMQLEPTKTFSPGDLVHEAFLRLAGQDTEDAKKWNDPAYFYAAASKAMRRILVERARAKKCLKRGGNLSQTELSLTRIETEDGLDIAELDDALTEFEKLYPDDAKLIHLKYFVGLPWEEIAELTGESARNVRRKWAFARAWLRNQM